MCCVADAGGGGYVAVLVVGVIVLSVFVLLCRSLMLLSIVVVLLLVVVLPFMLTLMLISMVDICGVGDTDSVVGVTGVSADGVVDDIAVGCVGVVLLVVDMVTLVVLLLVFGVVVGWGCVVDSVDGGCVDVGVVTDCVVVLCRRGRGCWRCRWWCWLWLCR